MKKYSVYNCYKGCQHMRTLSEAIGELAAVTELTELAELDTKVSLYSEIFYGFGNTKEAQEEYDRKKQEMLEAFSEEEKEVFAEMVTKKYENAISEASKEFQERINDIDKRSKVGCEEGNEPFDLEKLETKKGKRYNKTRFSKLTNLCIGMKYQCDDTGVYCYNKTDLEYVRVCDALTIKNLFFDETANQQYIEIEYYDYGSIKTVCIESGHLATTAYSELMKLGIVIDNAKLFVSYINDLRSIDREVSNIKKGKANMYYGYIKKEDGSLDFGTFVGIGEDNKVIPLPEYANLDKSLFNKKGTVESFIQFLSEVSKGKYSIDFQMVVAASLSGIVQAYVNNGMNIIAPPAYVFVGKSSIGKNLLAALANLIWANPSATGIICSSDSSPAFMYTLKHRIQYLPFILADIQDLLNKKEQDVSVIADIVFAHSNGVSGGKSDITGRIRNNMRFWNCPLIVFNEADVFTGSARITGGADARLTILDLRVAPEDKYLTIHSPKSYIALEKENYGVLGEAFVLAMRDKKPEEIAKRFAEITDELESLGVQQKQANSLGMLVLTDELAKSFGLLPSEWEALNCKRLTDWNGIKEITDPMERMYTLLSEYVMKDISYVPNDDPMFVNNQYGQTEKQVFELRMKTEREIRGRIVWERKDVNGEWQMCPKEQRERTLLLIPNLQLNQLFNHLMKESDLHTFGFDKKRWEQNGWLIKSDTGYTFKGKHHLGITRPYEAKNREYYYAIIVKENGSDEKK